MEDQEKLKCEKCGIEMAIMEAKYAKTKEEGQSADKTSCYPVYYCCMNETCENYGKNIKILKKF